MKSVLHAPSHSLEGQPDRLPHNLTWKRNRGPITDRRPRCRPRPLGGWGASTYSPRRGPRRVSHVVRVCHLGVDRHAANIAGRQCDQDQVTTACPVASPRQVSSDRRPGTSHCPALVPGVVTSGSRATSTTVVSRRVYARPGDRQAVVPVQARARHRRGGVREGESLPT